MGDSNFVEQVLAQDTLLIEERSQRQQQGWSLARLIENVCVYCDVEQKQLLSKARANTLSQAKALICFWGTQELGYTMREIANRLAISQPAVSNWVKQGQMYCKEQGVEFKVIEN